MIEELKKKLVVRYTLIIFAISAIIFVSGYMSYRAISMRSIRESLVDYSVEELREAYDHIDSGSIKTEIYSTNTDRNSIHNFSYWFANNKLIYAESPNQKVGEELIAKIKKEKFAAQKIVTFSIVIDHKMWNFMVYTAPFEHAGIKGAVVVLSNITALQSLSYKYKLMGSLFILFLVLMSYLTGKKITNGVIEPIIEVYNRQKDFVANASHELKTPLSVALTYLEILEKKNGKNTEIATIKDEIFTMNSLIQNLTELTKIDKGIYKPNRKAANVQKSLKDVVKRFNAINSDRRQIELHSNIGPEIKFDAGALERVATIFLDNAVKYSEPDSQITVCLNRHRNEFYLSVEDRGIGIDKEELGRIFERFYRVDTSHSKRVEGLGLGLSIAYEITNKLGGKIEVNSKKGQGSIFKVTFPLKG